MNKILNEISVLLLRQLKLSLAHKKSLIFMTIISLAIIFIIGSGLGTFVETKDLGINFTQFFGPGYLALIVAWGGLATGSDLLHERKGFTRFLLIAPISNYSILFGTILSSILGFLILSPPIIIFFLIFIKSLSFIKLINSLLFIILLVIGFSGFGLWFSSFFKNEKTYQMVIAMVYWFIFFLSGALYPTKNLPIFLKVLVSLNPLTYGIDALRWALVGFTEFTIFFDTFVLLIFSFISLVLGTYLFDKSLRR